MGSTLSALLVAGVLRRSGDGRTHGLTLDGELSMLPQSEDDREALAVSAGQLAPVAESARAQSGAPLYTAHH